jgi:hypothetical protein
MIRTRMTMIAVIMKLPPMSISNHPQHLQNQNHQQNHQQQADDAATEVDIQRVDFHAQTFH